MLSAYPVWGPLGPTHGFCVPDAHVGSAGSSRGLQGSWQVPWTALPQFILSHRQRLKDQPATPPAPIRTLAANCHPPRPACIFPLKRTSRPIPYHHHPLTFINVCSASHKCLVTGDTAVNNTSFLPSRWSPSSGTDSEHTERTLWAWHSVQRRDRAASGKRRESGPRGGTRVPRGCCNARPPARCASTSP